MTAYVTVLRSRLPPMLTSIRNVAREEGKLDYYIFALPCKAGTLSEPAILEVAFESKQLAFDVLYVPLNAIVVGPP